MSPSVFPPPDPSTVWKVRLDPESIATGRTGLELNDASLAIEQSGIDFGQAAISAYEAQMGQYGSSMVDFRVPNRTVTIPFAVGVDDISDFFTARRELIAKVGTIMREGGIIQRGFDVPMYADIVTCTLTFPDQWGETGLYQTGCTLTLECLPDFYGDEIALDAVTVTGPHDQLLLKDGVTAEIAGDMPGRCRIVITDGSGVVHDGIIWGFRSRNYSAAATARLVYEAETLTPIAPATLGSDSDASGSVITRTLTASTWVPVMSTNLLSGGPMTHVGSYRVWARVLATSSTQIPWFQLLWGVGGLYSTAVINDPVTLPSVGSFFLADLGQVNIPGSRNAVKWSGQINALGGASDPGACHIDRIYLQPLDETAGVLEGTQAAGGLPGSHILYANEQCEIATDGVMRVDSGTVQWAPIAAFGDLPRCPVSGIENRPVELLVIGSQGDIETLPDGPDYNDEQTVQVHFRPSFLFVP